MGEGYLTWMKRAESALFGAMVHLDGIMIWHFNGKAITKKLQTCLIPSFIVMSGFNYPQ